MHYWNAYTGRSLILGSGRAIRQVISMPSKVTPLLEAAQEQYEVLNMSLPKDTFIAALMAPLAMQELGTDATDAEPFSSAAQLFSLFDELEPEQLATNLINGRIASAYASFGNIEATTQQVTQAFIEGNLLLLPRDTVRLHAPETLNMLPGIIAFMLTRQEATQKAFTNYLRHGTPPEHSTAHDEALGNFRPVLSTWAREARLEREMTRKDSDD